MATSGSSSRGFLLVRSKIRRLLFFIVDFLAYFFSIIFWRTSLLRSFTPVLRVGWPCGLRLPILSALKFDLHPQDIGTASPRAANWLEIDM